MISKKGFTLIELLAVIVILAIILLIATPLVLNVIEGAKKGAFEASAGMVMKAVENEHLREKLNGGTGEIEVVIEDYTQTSTDKLELNKNNIKEGYIHINTAGTVTMVVTDGTTIIEKDPNQKELNTLEETYESQDLLAMYTTLKESIPSFACGELLTDDRDGNTYETIQIGDQCWFAEDLKYDCSLAGYTNIANGTSWSGSNNCGNQGAGYDGMLYQWNVAMNGSTTEGEQGLCPDGWHIATDAEWKELEMHLGMSQAQADLTGYRGTNEGQQLKSIDPSWGGTNTVGFNAKPAGHRNTSGSLNNVGSNGSWWSSSPSATSAWERSLHSSLSTVYHGTDSQDYGFSVRCLLGQ